MYQFPIGKGKSVNGEITDAAFLEYQFPIGKGKLWTAIFELKEDYIVSIPNRER